MRLVRIITITTACAACAACGAGAGSTPPPAASADGIDAVVRRVVDGDTLITRIDGADERVRMLGVDAPESVAENRPIECYGPQASARTKALLPKGTRVTLATDPTQGDRDQYGRLLAEVTAAGATITVNEQLIADGYAEVFRGDGRGRLQPRLRAAERSARDHHRGLWSACRT